MAFSEKIKNLPAYSNADGVRVRKLPGTTAAATVLYTAKKNEGIGIATGNTSLDSSKAFSWVQIRPDSSKIKNAEFVYVSSDYVVYGPATSEITKAQAQGLLDTITSTDKKIRENLVEMSKAMGILQARGINTESYRKAQNDLLIKMLARHRAIEQSSYVKIQKQLNLQTGFSANYNQADWKSAGPAQGGAFMMGIGAVTLPVWLVISAVVVGVAALTYQFLKPHFEQGQLDLKTSELYKSELLNKAKQGLTIEEQKQLDKELEQWAKDNYNKGKGESNNGILGWLLGLSQTDKLMIGGGLLTWAILKLRATNHPNKRIAL